MLLLLLKRQECLGDCIRLFLVTASSGQLNINARQRSRYGARHIAQTRASNEAAADLRHRDLGPAQYQEPSVDLLLLCINELAHSCRRQLGWSGPRSNLVEASAPAMLCAMLHA